MAEEDGLEEEEGEAETGAVKEGGLEEEEKNLEGGKILRREVSVMVHLPEEGGRGVVVGVARPPGGVVCNNPSSNQRSSSNRHNSTNLSSPHSFTNSLHLIDYRRHGTANHPRGTTTSSCSSTVTLSQRHPTPASRQAPPQPRLRSGPGEGWFDL